MDGKDQVHPMGGYPAPKQAHNVFEAKHIKKSTGCEKSIGPPCHTKFDLFSIVLGKSDETMPYRLDLGNSFAVVYIAVTCLVQELY